MPAWRTLPATSATRRTRRPLLPIFCKKQPVALFLTKQRVFFAFCLKLAHFVTKNFRLGKPSRRLKTFVNFVFCALQSFSSASEVLQKTFDAKTMIFPHTFGRFAYWKRSRKTFHGQNALIAKTKSRVCAYVGLFAFQKDQKPLQKPRVNATVKQVSSVRLPTTNTRLFCVLTKTLTLSPSFSSLWYTISIAETRCSGASASSAITT